MSEDSKTYAIPEETIAGLPMEDHLSDLLQIKAFIESRGIRTANTRIDRYCECLRRIVAGDLKAAPLVFGNHPTETFADADYVLYVLREVHELMWILKGLNTCQPIGVDEKLKEVVSGADFAAKDLKSASRNTQFELRIASYFCQSGFEVDLSRITDVVAFNDRIAFYVECKRVASDGQLERRLSDAKSQLHARMPKKVGGRLIHGCVAADVTKVAFPHNGVTWAMTSDHSREVIGEKLIGIVGGLRDDSLFRNAGGLLHYWFQIHMPALIRYPETVATRFSSYHIFREGLGRKGMCAIKMFADAFEGVSKMDERVLPPTKLSRKKGITIPAGTLFDFDDALIGDLLAGGDVPRRDPEEVIGRMEIEGVEYEFSFFEFEMIVPKFTDEEKAELAANSVQAGMLVLAKMLYWRQPYES